MVKGQGGGRVLPAILYYIGDVGGDDFHF